MSTQIIRILPYAAAVLITAASLASALSFSSKNKLAKAEIHALREQIVHMEAYFTETADAIPEISSMTEEIENAALSSLMPVSVEKEAETEIVEEPPADPPPEARESFQERMARMKEESPEEYAEMIQRRKDRQQTMRYNFAERAAVFMNLDISSMTPEEQKNHESLLNKMARIWELTDQFQDPEAPPKQEAIREMFTEMRQTQPLMNKERKVMFRTLGSDLGYEKKEAAAFAEQVEEIIHMTTLQIPGRRGTRTRNRRL